MSILFGSKGLYRNEFFMKYGQNFYRDRRKRQSPYRITTYGSDSSGVDYGGKNIRTGWKKYYTRYAGDGGQKAWFKN